MNQTAIPGMTHPSAAPLSGRQTQGASGRGNSGLARNERSWIGRWWLTLDHSFFFCTLVLLAIGALVVLSASPSAAARFETGLFHFSKRHMLFLSIGLTLLLITSTLNWRQLRWLAQVSVPLGLLALLYVLLFEEAVGGATRWIRVGGYFTIQPIEFLKPMLMLFCAQQLAALAMPDSRARIFWLGAIIGLVMILLWMQPDIGQMMLIGLSIGLMLFVAGTRQLLLFIGGGSALGILAVLAFIFQRHVYKRVNEHIQELFGGGSPDVITQEDIAQRTISLLGVGPGEGTIKDHLPAAHTDYVLAVIAEEMGVVVCVAIIGIFGYLLARLFRRLNQEQELFHFLAMVGLGGMLFLQMLINALSTFRLIPTTGMTLPLVSYGGSSLLASCLSIGMLLALMRSRQESRYG